MYHLTRDLYRLVEIRHLSNEVIACARKVLEASRQAICRAKLIQSKLEKGKRGGLRSELIHRTRRADDCPLSQATPRLRRTNGKTTIIEAAPLYALEPK